MAENNNTSSGSSGSSNQAANNDSSTDSQGTTFESDGQTVEIGPIRDADTGEVIDPTPTTRGDQDDQSDLTEPKPNDTGDGERQVVVTGGPGTGKPQKQVGVGQTREQAFAAAARNPDFDAFEGTSVDRFEEALGTDTGAERPDKVVAEADIGVRPGETGAEARPSPRQDQEFEVVQASEARRNQAREDQRQAQQDFAETAQRLGLQGQLNQETQNTQQVNIEDQGFTRTATTAELNRERPEANLQNIINPVTDIGQEFTTPPQGQQEFLTPSSVENIQERQEQEGDFFAPQVETETFQANRELPGGTNIEGVSFLTQDLPRGDVDVVPTFDFGAEETNQQVQETLQPIVGENVAEQAAFTATTGTVLAEEVANIPAGIGAFAERPVEAGSQAVTSFGETLAGTRGSGDVQQIRQGLIIGGLAAGPLTASGTGASGTARAASLTDDAGITTAARRASGVEGARETARILRRKGSDVRERLVGSTSPREDRLVFQSGREGTDIADPREDFADIDTEQLPELTQRFRDEPGPRPEVRGGRVDRPEEGLTPEEVEVLTGRDPGQLGVRQEGPTGGIQEAFTRERRVFAGGDVDPSEEFLTLEDLERARAVREGRQAARRVREAATGERKGQAQLVTRQDTTGRDIDFERPADTTDVQRARPTAEDIQGPDLDDVVDDFSRTARRTRDGDTGTDLGTDLDVSRISGLENPAALRLGEQATQETGINQELGLNQGQRQEQTPEEDVFRREEIEQRNPPEIASSIFNVGEADTRPPIPEEENIFRDPDTPRRTDNDLERPRTPDIDLDDEDDTQEIEEVFGTSQTSSEDLSFTPTVRSVALGQTQQVTQEEARQLREEQVFSGLGQRGILEITDTESQEEQDLRSDLGI